MSTGLLKIEVGKEVFERTGLAGKPIRSGGRKHGKERFRTHHSCSNVLIGQHADQLNSGGTESTIAFNATWQKRLRENCVGIQKRP